MSKNGHKICLKIYLTACLKRSLKIVSLTWPLIFKLKISKQQSYYILKRKCKQNIIWFITTTFWMLQNLWKEMQTSSLGLYTCLLKIETHCAKLKEMINFANSNYIQIIYKLFSFINLGGQLLGKILVFFVLSNLKSKDKPKSA